MTEVQQGTFTDPQDITGQLQVKRFRLTKELFNGAARKRLRWLIFNGLSYEEARKKALQPMPTEEKDSKQLRSDGSTPEMAEKKRRVETNDGPLSLKCHKCHKHPALAC